MASEHSKPAVSVRERLLDAAYNLFATQGITRVGIDAIVTRSGCAKASLYNNFHSKEELAIAFLARREELWTYKWLEAEIMLRSSDPQQRLLAIFDVFDVWFRRDDFEGCSFINVLLESEISSRVRAAATKHLENIRAIVRKSAEAAGLDNATQFAQCWHMLMKGAIVSAGEGNIDAARDARRAGEILLAGWDRNS